MKPAYFFKAIVILSSITILSSCTPSILIQPTENLDAGQVKIIKAEVKAACGYTRVYSKYKKSTAAGWINLAPPAGSGDLFLSVLPNSQNFAEGDTYDFQWAVDYDRKRKSIFNSNCDVISSSTVSAGSSFTVPACLPGSSSALPVPMYGQETDQWCWAASGQMIMDYLGTTVAQCTEANDSFGRTDCCNDNGGTCGGMFSVLVYILNHAACINPGWPDFGNYGFDSTVLNDALSWNDLRKQLSDAPHCRKTPVAFSWGWSGGGGHMMVARGYASVTVPMFGNFDVVAIRDPWPPCSGDSKIITYGEYVERKGDHVHWSDYYDIRRRP